MTSLLVSKSLPVAFGAEKRLVLFLVLNEARESFYVEERLVPS